jgi:hypothetical protein
LTVYSSPPTATGQPPAQPYGGQQQPDLSQLLQLLAALSGGGQASPQLFGLGNVLPYEDLIRKGLGWALSSASPGGQPATGQQQPQYGQQQPDLAKILQLLAALSGGGQASPQLFGLGNVLPFEDLIRQGLGWALSSASPGGQQMPKPPYFGRQPGPQY